MRLFVRLVLQGSLMCGAAFIGCDNAVEESATESSATSSTAAGQETEAERCRKKLAGAIRRLDPENFDTLSRRDRAVNGLNAWLTSCAADDVEALKVSDATLQMLDPDARRQVTAGRYTSSDAFTIRDALLMRKLSDALSRQVDLTLPADQRSEASRTAGMFQWVVRNVSLMPDDEQRVPVGMFEILLTGRGTAEDRAWLFAELLRQRQIDAVVLHPSAAPTSDDPTDIVESAAWLIAVMIDDAVLLFDAVSGTALSPADGSTTDEVVFQPAGLEALSSSARWHEPDVLIVAQSSAFAPRMLVLQEQLAAEDSAILYEELTGGTSAIRPLIERISSRGDGAFAAARISVWSHPDSRAAAAASLSEDQQAAYTDLMRPFEAPFERDTASSGGNPEEFSSIPEQISDEERKQMLEMRLMEEFERTAGSSEDMFGKPSGRLKKTRTRQISGSNDLDLIQQLQQIRIASTQEQILIRVPEQVRQAYGYPEIMPIPFPPRIREVNQSATADTLYWTAMLQLSRNEDGAAVTTLGNYLRSYPDGKWHYPALINQALANLRLDRFDAAISALKEADQPDNPERARAKVLLKRLSQ